MVPRTLEQTHDILTQGKNIKPSITAKQGQKQLGQACLVVLSPSSHGNVSAPTLKNQMPRLLGGQLQTRRTGTEKGNRLLQRLTWRYIGHDFVPHGLPPHGWLFEPRRFLYTIGAGGLGASWGGTEPKRR